MAKNMNWSVSKVRKRSSESTTAKKKKKKKKKKKWQNNCAPNATLKFKQREFYDKSGLNSGGSNFLFRQWQSLCYCLTMWTSTEMEVMKEKVGVNA